MFTIIGERMGKLMYEKGKRKHKVLQKTTHYSAVQWRGRHLSIKDGRLDY